MNFNIHWTSHQPNLCSVTSPNGQVTEQIWLRALDGGRKPTFEKRKWLAGWLAHHVSGFAHPSGGYIIGIRVLLHMCSLLWVALSRFYNLFKEF